MNAHAYIYIYVLIQTFIYIYTWWPHHYLSVYGIVVTCFEGIGHLHLFWLDSSSLRAQALLRVFQKYINSFWEFDGIPIQLDPCTDKGHSVQVWPKPAHLFTTIFVPLTVGWLPALWPLLRVVLCTVQVYNMYSPMLCPCGHAQQMIPYRARSCRSLTTITMC